MEKYLNFDFVANQKILKQIGTIEYFNGRWISVEKEEDQPLTELCYLATVESIGSSTRIEGVAMTNKEIDDLLKNLKIQKFSNRDEQDVAGYYETLDIVLDNYDVMPLSESTIKQLHSLLLKYSTKDKKHKGAYKTHPNKVVATYPTGEQRTIFNTTSPLLTPIQMEQAVKWTNASLKKKEIHPIISVATFIYEFLSIHPFSDGNGRLSRLLTTYLLLRCGYYYVQYVSFENQIEKHKKKYYASLRTAQENRGTKEENIQEWVLFFLDCMVTMTEVLEKKYQQLKDIDIYLNQRQQNILKLVKQAKQVKLADLIIKFNTVSESTLKKDLQILVTQKKLDKKGKLKGTTYFLHV